jgi:uncharacterized protein
MITQDIIKAFLSQQCYAIAGVSTDRKKFGNIVFRAFIKEKMKVYAINPHVETVEGNKAYKNIQEVPEEVKALIIITSPKKTTSIVEEAIRKGIKHIWIQRSSESPEALAYTEKKGVNIIHGLCVLMFIQQNSFPHNLHRFFFKFNKKFPK